MNTHANTIGNRLSLLRFFTPIHCAGLRSNPRTVSTLMPLRRLGPSGVLVRFADECA